MKNKDKIRKLKKVRVLAIALGTSAVFGLSGCGKEEDKSFEKVLESLEDNTCLDEVLSKNDAELLYNITKLEDYLELSNKLNKEKIDKVYIPEEQLKKETLLKVDEIETLLTKYKENKEDEKSLYQLNVQEKLINNFIASEGYKYTSKLGLWLLKSKIADSYKVNTDIATDIAESITIPSKSEMRYDQKYPSDFEQYLPVGTGEVKINNDYSNLLSAIYKLQENSNFYNKTKNESLEYSIKDMKRIMPKKYKLKLKNSLD